ARPNKSLRSNDVSAADSVHSKSLANAMLPEHLAWHKSLRVVNAPPYLRMDDTVVYLSSKQKVIDVVVILKAVKIYQDRAAFQLHKTLNPVAALLVKCLEHPALTHWF